VREVSPTSLVVSVETQATLRAVYRPKVGSEQASAGSFRSRGLTARMGDPP